MVSALESVGSESQLTNPSAQPRRIYIVKVTWDITPNCSAPRAIYMPLIVLPRLPISFPLLSALTRYPLLFVDLMRTSRRVIINSFASEHQEPWFLMG